MESIDPLILLNPAANRGKLEPYRTLIASRLAREKGDYVETGRPGEVQERSLQAASQGRPLIVVGGDGTLFEAVNGMLLAGRRVPLGIVAAGSGNDFARSTLQLPSDPALAIECAFTGRVVEVDAGKVNGKYFANALGIGLDAQIAATVETLKKLPVLSGGQLYTTAAVWQLLFGSWRCPWLTMSLDNASHPTKAHKRYLLIAISNGPAYGAGFRINPGADCRDGLFDICTIDATPLLRALKLLPVVKKGEHAGLPEVTFSRARRVQIQSRTEVPIHLDGETSRGTCFDVEMVPKALSIRIPE